MRYPVVLFDLDGTLIDSGPIILASMRHAATTVLGLEIDEAKVRAAIGGPGLVAQMRDLDPDRVDELVEAYRAHNEPLHEELEAFDRMLAVHVRGAWGPCSAVAKFDHGCSRLNRHGDRHDRTVHDTCTDVRV